MWNRGPETKWTYPPSWYGGWGGREGLVGPCLWPFSRNQNWHYMAWGPDPAQRHSLLFFIFLLGSCNEGTYNRNKFETSIFLLFFWKINQKIWPYRGCYWALTTTFKQGVCPLVLFSLRALSSVWLTSFISCLAQEGIWIHNPCPARHHSSWFVV